MWKTFLTIAILILKGVLRAPYTNARKQQRMAQVFKLDHDRYVVGVDKALTLQPLIKAFGHAKRGVHDVKCTTPKKAHGSTSRDVTLINDKK